jgi:PAS domain S-box-containing protein
VKTPGTKKARGAAPPKLSPSSTDKLTTVSVPEQFAPIFQKAQDYVARYFADRIEDPAQSSIIISGERYILVRAASMSVEFFELVQSLYREQGIGEARSVANNILFDLAHSLGKADERSFHTRMNVTDPIERLSAGPIQFAYSGWAFVKILPESRPSPDENYYLIFDHPFSFESDAWLKHTKGKVVDFPVCIMNAGYSSGWCEESFGMPLVSAEVECLAKGDAQCRFIMAPPAQIEEHLARYFLEQPTKSRGKHPAPAKSVSVPEFFYRWRMESELKKSHDQLEQRVQERTKELARTSEELRLANERFQMAGRAVNSVIFELDLANKKVVMARGIQEVFGYSEEGTERPLSWWLEKVHPEDRERLEQELRRSARDSSGDFYSEFRFQKKDGDYRHILDRALIIRDSTGRPVRTIGALVDINDRKLLEEELRQAQKMEAVGRLAGGVAHDFNNLLTVIKGYAELLSAEPADTGTFQRNLEQIRKATDRAAALTRQLLAFSRRQVLALEALEVGEIVQSMQELLQRLLGEDVELETHIGSDLGQVRADRGQIEQVLMNLAINSRDAMPQGGKLVITTDNIDLSKPVSSGRFTVMPGEYVVLTVTDTGSGMDEETQSHIFEPFFTTKEQGKGTGLGLSTVYGIVKQSGGYIWVSSESGKGTSFKIYLPRVFEQAAAAMPLPVKEREGFEQPGSNTLLLVEDEAGIRELTSELLAGWGYEVLVARNGVEGLEIGEKYQGTIHLMLTDVVMPHMNGRDLAHRLRQTRPEMKVIYMSGYTDNLVLQGGMVEEGSDFIQKPFNSETLARRVRAALQSPAATK